MKFSSFKSQKGFSLVELMLVVGIIGILSTLAMPRFKQFQAKAKMGEAKSVLSHILTLEQTYALDNNTFLAIATNMGADPASLTTNVNCLGAAIPANAALIGFQIDPCPANSPVPRYGYSVPTATASTLIAAAVSGANNTNRVCPGNAAHYYAINEANIVFGNTGSVVPAAAPTPATEPAVGVICAN